MIEWIDLLQKFLLILLVHSNLMQTKRLNLPLLQQPLQVMSLQNVIMIKRTVRQLNLVLGEWMGVHYM